VWRDSRSLFAHALSVTRPSVVAHVNFGSALADQGRPAEALSHFEAALTMHPTSATSLFNRAKALQDAGRREAAVAAYTQLLDLHPDHPGARNNLGNLLVESGRVIEAVEHFLVVLRRQPDSVDTLSNLGGAMAAAGRLSAAEVYLRRAVALAFHDTTIRGNLAVVLEHNGKPTEALAHWAEVIRSDPGEGAAYAGIGRILMAQGKHDGAEAFLAKAAELASTTGTGPVFAGDSGGRP
jgi:Flp pilus assembly protein TadD